jgi:hypothetical protein
MKFKNLLFLVAFTFSIAAFAQDIKTADEVLSKYLANTGGLEKWKALKTVKMTGKASMQGMDLPVTLFKKEPVKQKMLIQVQGTEIVQAYDGVDAWMINPFMGGKDPVKMTEEQALEFKDQKFEDEFIDYKKKGHEVTLMGNEEVEGVKCYKIQLIKNKNNDKEDVTEVHYFDAENFVPILQVSYVRVGPDKGKEVKTYLSDYQDVNGLMMPFFIEQKMNGQSFQKITIEKAFTNEPMEDSMFVFPKK